MMEEEVFNALIRLRDTYLTAKESSQNCADNIQALKQEYQLLNQLLSAQTKISEGEVGKILSMHDSTVESKEMLKRAEQKLHFLKSRERYAEQLQRTLMAQDENLSKENHKLKSAELQFMLLSPLLKQMIPQHKPTIELYETHLLSTIDHDGLRLWF